jgi:hypothetical protein
MHARVIAVSALGAMVGCGANAMHPPFRGRTDAGWVAYDVKTDSAASDVLRPFSARAKELGCSIDWLCEPGFRRRCYGVAAYCYDQTIALVARQNGVFTVGCLRPSTVAECDALLTKIMSQDERRW